MYSLIKFNTGEYTVLKSQNVEKTERGTCVAKYRGSKYLVFVVATSDHRPTLSNLEHMYEIPLQNEQCAPGKSPGKGDSSSTSNIRCHVKKNHRRKLSKRKRNVTATNKYNKNQSNVDENKKLLQNSDKPKTIDSVVTFDSDKMSQTKELLNDTLNMRHEKSTYVENSSLPPSAICDTIVIANYGCEIFLKKAEFITDITDDKPTNMIDSNSACDSDKISHKKALSNDNNLQNINTQTLNLLDQETKYGVKTSSTSNNSAFSKESCSTKYVENNSNKECSSDLTSGGADGCSSSECIQNLSTHMSEHALEDSNKTTNEKADIAEIDAHDHLNVNQISVPYSENNCKKRFCIFCKKLQSKINRHLYLRHKHEKEVKKALRQERLHVINNIGKRGGFEHNTSAAHNSGVLIVNRQQHRKSKTMLHDFIFCKTCKRFVSKRTIRIHKKRCSSSNVQRMNITNDMKNSNTETLNLPQEKQIFCYKTRSISKSRAALGLSSTNNDDNSSNKKYIFGVDSGQTECIQEPSADMGERTIENSNESTTEQDGIVEIESESRKKKHFCMYCKKLQCNISRHLFLGHNHEKEVKKALSFPKRSQLINDIRKGEDFERNTSAEYKSAVLIVTRQQQRKFKKMVDDFVCCKTCKRVFSKRTIRLHKKKCSSSKFERSYGIDDCRMVKYRHPVANIETLNLPQEKIVYSYKTRSILKNGALVLSSKSNDENSSSEEGFRGWYSGQTDEYSSSECSRDFSADMSELTLENSIKTNTGGASGQTDKCSSSECSQDFSADMSERTLENSNKTNTGGASGQTDKCSSLECTQNLSADVSERTLENFNKTTREKDSIAEIDAELNLNQILGPYPESKQKRHFCIFCKELQTKISRHLYLNHKHEKEVKQALSFPKNSKERLQLISGIRKRGDFEHNTSAEYNSGVLIVSRQQQRKFKKLVHDYICCKICKGFFSKRTIRIHKKRCSSSKIKRSSEIDGRSMTQYSHSVANDLKKSNPETLSQPQERKMHCYKTRSTSKISSLVLSSNSNDENSSNKKHFPGVDAGHTDKSSALECIQDHSADMGERTLKNSSKNTTEKDDIVEIFAPLNVNQVLVPYSESKQKRHFCIYCKKLQTKISRHLYLKHKHEKEVKQALSFPKNSQERLKLISDIRKRGDFEHNTSPEYNSGVLIVSRQQQRKSKKMVDDFVCCKTCKGFFSKTTIRKHKRRCSSSKGERCHHIDGRRMTQYIHPIANNLMKTEIFPILRCDDVVKSIRYDELAIKFGNYLAEKYPIKHLHDMIRSKLRLIGRFKTQFKKLDSEIDELKDIFKEHLIEKCIKASRNTAGWSVTSRQFESPAVAQNLISLIKKCCKIQKNELIKKNQKDLQNEVEKFLKLWKEKNRPFSKESTRAKKNAENNSNKECSFELSSQVADECSSSECIPEISPDMSERALEDSSKTTTAKDTIVENTTLVHKSSCSSSKDGRRMAQDIHPIANNLLKKKIFPILRCDDVVESIRHDELAIKFGNYLAEKYPQNHLHNMIRAKLRLIGRFKIQFKKLDNAIDEMKDIYKAHLFEKCVKAIRNTVGWNETFRRFENAAAQNLTSIIKKCWMILRIELIRENQKDLQNEVDKFIELWEENNGAFFSEENSSTKNVENNSNKECSSDLSARDAAECSSLECIQDVSAGISEHASENSNKTNTAKDTTVKNSSGVHKSTKASSMDSFTMTQHIHPVANNLLKKEIFPILRCDYVVEIIRYDELAIKFGNYLAEQYPQKHLHNMIRAKLRLIGRFKIQFKKLDNAIDELKDIYKEHLFDKCIKAIRNTVGWNETYGRFETPAAAQNLTSIIRRCCKIQRKELIKENQKDLQRELEKFLKLWDGR